MGIYHDGLTMRRAHGAAAIDPRAWYRIAQLRQEIFVVEQNCPYLDLDGRDLESTTLHLWLETRHGDIAAYVRVLDEERAEPHGGVDPEPGLRSIGRVVTSASHRGRGLAAQLIDAALDECEGHPVALYAQSHLTRWYGRFGFHVCGPDFLEDGISHTPMMRR